VPDAVRDKGEQSTPTIRGTAFGDVQRKPCP
jgi:hypothetical protein